MCVIGMVMILEGLPYFAVPSKMKEWFQKIFELPDNVLRFMGFILMITGLVLVYFGKK